MKLFVTIRNLKRYILFAIEWMNYYDPFGTFIIKKSPFSMQKKERIFGEIPISLLTMLRVWVWMKLRFNWHFQLQQFGIQPRHCCWFKQAKCNNILCFCITQICSYFSWFSILNKTYSLWTSFTIWFISVWIAEKRNIFSLVWQLLAIWE